MSKLSTNEFAKKIKSKYPQYADIDDTILVQRVLDKNPVYRDKVDFKAPETKPSDLPSPFKQIRRFATGSETPYFEQQKQDYDRYKRASSLPLKDQLKQFGKDVVGDVKDQAVVLSRLLPFASVGAPAKGAANLLKWAAKSGALAGAGVTAENVLRGQGVHDAATEGQKAMATGASLSAAIPGASNLIGRGIRETGANVAKLKPWVLDRFKKNPKLLTEGAENIYDTAQKVSNTHLYNTKKLIEEQFNKKIDKLNPGSGKIVSTKGIPDQIKKLDLDQKVVLSKLLSSAKREGVVIKPSTLRRFVYGNSAIDKPKPKKIYGFIKPDEKTKKKSIRKKVQRITSDEARKINSLLFQISKSNETEKMGRGFIGKMDSLKTHLVKEWDKAVPGVKNANKYYSKRLKFYNEANSVFGDTKTSEGLLNQIGQQASGINKNKTKVFKILRDLDRYQTPKSRILNKLPDQAAVREFENRFLSSNFGNTLRAIGPSITGSIAGSTLGPTGAAAGALGGLAVGNVASNPEAIKKVLELANRYQGSALPGAIDSFTRGAGRVSGATLSRVFIKRRNEDGRVTQEARNRMKQEDPRRN